MVNYDINLNAIIASSWKTTWFLIPIAALAYILLSVCIFLCCPLKTKTTVHMCADGTQPAFLIQALLAFGIVAHVYIYTCLVELFQSRTQTCPL